jgi:diacylglycerol kinase (ATP)
MDKVHVIVNPLSARGRTCQRWDAIKEIIRHYFTEFKYIFTEKPRQATEIARYLLKDGFDLIIGVGGDGTVNEIANGYFHQDSQQAINGDASLAIIPSGTGSDFVRSQRIPRDFKRSIETIKNSGVKAIDVGKITFNFDSAEAERSSAYFVNVADFGLGAEVSRTVAAVPSSKRGPFSYYLGLLSTIRNYKSKKVKVVIDGTEEISDRFLIGAVANGSIFGGGMIIAPGAKPDDGYFDLVLVEDMGRFEIIKSSTRLYTGTLPQHPKVKVKRVKNIKVYPAETDEGLDQTVNIEYDGEIGKSIPAEFEIIEKSVNFRI